MIRIESSGGADLLRPQPRPRIRPLHVQHLAREVPLQDPVDGRASVLEDMMVDDEGHGIRGNPLSTTIQDLLPRTADQTRRG